jgi:NAD(P) transhydrogenase subunit alpha
MDEDFYVKQREMMSQVVAQNDVVITTAAVPGKKAPILVTKEMVHAMRPGSVIVDLAADRGGNCELTRLDETVMENEVAVLGQGNLPSTIPYHASEMYARNVAAFVTHLLKVGTSSRHALSADMKDEILRETLVTLGGEVVHPRVKEAVGFRL